MTVRGLASIILSDILRLQSIIISLEIIESIYVKILKESWPNTISEERHCHPWEIWLIDFFEGKYPVEKHGYQDICRQYSVHILITCGWLVPKVFCLPVKIPGCGEKLMFARRLLFLDRKAFFHGLSGELLSIKTEAVLRITNIALDGLFFLGSLHKI